MCKNQTENCVFQPAENFYFENVFPGPIMLGNIVEILVCPANKIHIQIRNNIQIRRYSFRKCPALVRRTVFSDENQFTLI